MAVTVLVVWMCTLGAGLSLLVTSKPSASTDEAAAERQPVAVAQTATETKATQGVAAAVVEPKVEPKKKRRQDPFAPPSLQRARSEPLPGLRSLLEFTHPALAITGFGFWTGYVVSRNGTLAIIACCVLGCTVAAGLTWFLSNQLRAKAPSFSGRLAAMHGACATITLLLAVLVVTIRLHPGPQVGREAT